MSAAIISCTEQTYARQGKKNECVQIQGCSPDTAGLMWLSCWLADLARQGAPSRRHADAVRLEQRFDGLCQSAHQLLVALANLVSKGICRCSAKGGCFIICQTCTPYQEQGSFSTRVTHSLHKLTVCEVGQSHTASQATDAVKQRQTLQTKDCCRAADQHNGMQMALVICHKHVIPLGAALM